MEKKYLEILVDTKVNATIFLTCNVKLQGVIKAVDENSILLEHEGRLQLIYKHAISTINAGTVVNGDDIVE